MARSRWREYRDPLLRRQSVLARRGLVLPATRELPTTARGTVWAVGLIKNEADVLELTLRHLARQGVDVILVADNGSTDGSVEIVRKLRRQGLPVVAASDLEPCHIQGAKVTRMARFAHRHGADWVIPFDADELWFAKGTTVAAFLRESRSQIVRAAIHNVAPADKNVVLGAHRGWVIGERPEALYKVAFRPHLLARVQEGNHGVDRPGDSSEGLFIAHFPYRSPQQTARKVRQGAGAVAGLPDHIATHWRALAQLSDQQLADVWTSLIEGAAPSGLGWLPRGALLQVDVTSWATWQLEEARNAFSDRSHSRDGDAR